jgi:hypothetical protein
MAGYGYTSPRFGGAGVSDNLSSSRRYRRPSLTQAAAGKKKQADPFGLNGGQQAHAYAPPDAVVGNSQYGGQYAPPKPQQTGAPVTPQGQPQNTAPTAPNAYDINTDPALQQIQALTGMSDEQARASALKQKYDLLLGYGDPELARSVLGDESLATAAAGNPTSTRAQLSQSRDRNLHDLTEGLNQANLLYSGYRVNQEGQAANDYQNALAQAASGVNSGLGQIGENLSGTLGQNEQQRVAAMQDAYNRHATEAGAGGGDLEALLAQLLGGANQTDPYNGAGGEYGDRSGAGSLAGAPQTPETADDYLTALMKAAALRTQPVAY